MAWKLADKPVWVQTALALIITGRFQIGMAWNTITATVFKDPEE